MILMSAADSIQGGYQMMMIKNIQCMWKTSLVPHFVMLQNYSELDLIHFSPLKFLLGILVNL